MVGWLTASTVIVWLLAILGVVRTWRDPRWTRKLQHLLFAAGCAGVGLLLGALLALGQAFQIFSGETLVARVTTSRVSPDEFELVYAPAPRDGVSVPPLTVRLRGDQWSISGVVVKWHPGLTFLGVASYHRPTRLSGQFSDLQQQRAHFPTVYPLAPASGWLWTWLYWTDHYLPFVEAAYGSAAFVYVEPGTPQDVYVTPSGYLIKRASSRP